MDNGGNNASQTAFRFRADDGDESAWNGGAGSGASYLAPINTWITVPEGDTTKLRVRICAESSAENIKLLPERRLGGGSWFPVDPTDPVVQLGSTQLVGGNHTTDLEAWGEELSGAAWADTDNNAQLDDAAESTDFILFGSGQDKRMEVEIGLNIQWGFPIEEGNILQFRLTIMGQIFSQTYPEIPRIDITAPLAAARTPYPYQQRVHGPLLRR
jgi:hypothetical protein